jgi:translation initiation factor IF-1
LAVKEEKIELEGEITESLRNRMFRITLDNGHEMIGYTAGKMKRYRIRMGPGDRVLVELSSYDLDRGRIIYRRGMRDRADDLRLELAGLLEKHGPALTDGARADLLFLESQSGWQPGRRPMRPDPMVSAFLELFDRAEQEELAYGTLPAGSLDELRRVFRDRLSQSA